MAVFYVTVSLGSLDGALVMYNKLVEKIYRLTLPPTAGKTKAGPSGGNPRLGSGVVGSLMLARFSWGN
jgi:hypothetical protein